jgi:hypothetical protein
MAAGDKIIFQDPYVTLSVAELSGMWRFMRSGVPYPTVDAMRDSFLKIMELCSYLPKQQISLLVDMRQAPARNDPEFELVQRTLRKEMLLYFARRATLVSTTAGLLHVQRYSREDGVKVVGFTSEAEAATYLLTGQIPSPAK